MPELHNQTFCQRLAFDGNIDIFLVFAVEFRNWTSKYTWPGVLPTFQINLLAPEFYI
jgi:hypothetical protein